MLHRVPQPKSAAHVWLGLSQVTNPGLPHVERAAQRIALPRHPGETCSLTTCATQLTKRPWFVASAQGHCWLMAAWAAQRSASQSGRSACAKTPPGSTSRRATENKKLDLIGPPLRGPLYPHAACSVNKKKTGRATA